MDGPSTPERRDESPSSTAGRIGPGAGTVDRLFVVDSDSVHRIQEAQCALHAALPDRRGAVECRQLVQE